MTIVVKNSRTQKRILDVSPKGLRISQAEIAAAFSAVPVGLNLGNSPSPLALLKASSILGQRLSSKLSSHTEYGKVCGQAQEAAKRK